MTKSDLPGKLAAFLLLLAFALGMTPLPQVLAQESAEQAPEEKAEPPVIGMDRSDFEWDAWKSIPVLDDGRVKPIDTFAEEVVTLVTGRAKWTWQKVEEGQIVEEVKYKAPELLYSWIAFPDQWLDQKILLCEFRPLRKVMSTEERPLAEEGKYVSIRDILNWEESQKKGVPVFWSQDLQDRIRELELGARQDKQPNQIGETTEDKRINAKVAELFKHMQTFLTVREASRLYVVPGLDPRTLTPATNPDELLEPWVSFGSLMKYEDIYQADDVTMASVMADGYEDLLGWTVALQQNRKVFLGELFPQLMQAQSFKTDLQKEIKAVVETFELTKKAYADNNASQFNNDMDTFKHTLRVLGEDLNTKRPQMTPPEKNSADYKMFNKSIWDIYEPLELNAEVIASSNYPKAGAIDAELRYNKAQPFRSAWIYFLVATIVVGLSYMKTGQKWLYAAAILTSLVAILHSTYGFYLRILVSGRPPVTNMYETVIWVAYVVAILGVWFSALPYLWPGLSRAWSMVGIPLRFRPQEKQDASEETEEEKSSLNLVIRIVTGVIHAAAMVGIVWFLTSSNTSFKIISLAPPLFGKVISLGAVGVWVIGMSTVLIAAWYLPKVVMTLLVSLVTIPKSNIKFSGKIWDQVVERRFFLMGALPVACFGMMLAYFVGVRSPDILNPQIGSITAVLRNNYWLTIHVLTIVSSYGAGALAWGMGNLALVYYLFGKYRGGKTDNEGEAFSDRLKKAKAAMSPGKMMRSVKDNISGMGAGDEHLGTGSRRPPKEVATLATYCYKSMQVAVLLLAAGTILGGLWADVSWGRFWDWDPKEVWALISLLVYLVVLHGRFAGWIGTLGTNIGSVLCFSAIIMSWYGVNFVLPQIHGWLTGSDGPTEVGLHSYATGAGGLGYVITALLFNVMLVLAAGSRYVMETSQSSTPSAPEPVEEVKETVSAT